MLLRYLFWPLCTGFLGSLIGSVGSVVGGLFGNKSQRDTNAANAALSRENMEWMTEENLKQRDFNAEQAALDRSFQSDESGVSRAWSKDMSDTSYRRAVTDMKAAGLNPMLLAQQGGAHTPSASTASGSRANASSVGAPNMARMENAAASAMQVATGVTQAARAFAETQNIRDQNANIRAQTENIRADTNEKISGTGLKNLQSDLTTKQTSLTDANISKVAAEIGALKQSMITSGTSAEKNRKMIQLLEYQLPRALNEAVAQDTEYMRRVSPFLPDLLKSTSAVKGLFK